MDKVGMVRKATRKANQTVAWCRTSMVIGTAGLLWSMIASDWLTKFTLGYISLAVTVGSFFIGTMAVVSLRDLKADIAWDQYLKRDRYK